MRRVIDGERLSGHGNAAEGYPEILICDGQGEGDGSVPRRKNLMKTIKTPLIDEFLRECLEAWSAGSYHVTLIALLLKEGQHYLGSKKWRPRCGWRQGPPSQCYGNTFKLVSRDPTRYTYCEGYALARPSFPIEHAWVQDRDGLVIDRTLSDCTEYLGFPFKFQFCLKAFCEHRGSVLFGLMPTWGPTNPVYRLLHDREFRSKNVLVANGCRQSPGFPLSDLQSSR